jgi:hypothetical protein
MLNEPNRIAQGVLTRSDCQRPLILLPSLPNSGTSWDDANAPSGNRTWSSVSSSGTGGLLLAAEQGGQLYVSVDNGSSWTAQTPTPGVGNWTSVSVSRDGSTMLAVDGSGYIWTQRNGTGWTAQTYASMLPWSATAINADGSIMTVGTAPGAIFISTNYGKEAGRG